MADSLLIRDKYRLIIRPLTPLRDCYAPLYAISRPLHSFTKQVLLPRRVLFCYGHGLKFAIAHVFLDGFAKRNKKDKKSALNSDNLARIPINMDVRQEVSQEMLTHVQACDILCKKEVRIMNSSEIQKLVMELMSDLKEHSVQEIKTLMRDKGEDFTEGQFAGSINTLLRTGLIKKSSRGVYISSAARDNCRKCFFISPIGDENSETRKISDKVYKYIVMPVCSDVDITPERADQINQADVINNTIIEKLRTADIVIADITNHNPNVFYEVGYRAAIGKPIIYIKSSGEKIPFDIANVRVFDYNVNDLDSVEEIKTRLQKTIEYFSFEEEKEPFDGSSESRLGTIDATTVISMMYSLQDDINKLKEVVEKNNSELMASVVKAIVPQPVVEDPQTSMMKAILPELMKNPSSFAALLDMSERYKKKE